MGILTGPRTTAAGAQKVKQGVKSQKAQQDRINAADEQLGKQRIGIVKPLVDSPADHRAQHRTSQKSHGQLGRDVAQLFVYGSTHDGHGKDVEQVSPHRQDTLDAHGHECRGDDEAAPCSDTAGDQPRS